MCSSGTSEFSLDKYIMAIYLSLGKLEILLIPHPWLKASFEQEQSRGKTNGMMFISIQYMLIP